MDCVVILEIVNLEINIGNREQIQNYYITLFNIMLQMQPKWMKTALENYEL